jgi:hypothetical protein
VREPFQVVEVGVDVGCELHPSFFGVFEAQLESAEEAGATLYAQGHEAELSYE